MYDAFSRMENLLGTKGVKRLGSAKIAVFGIGGIGGSSCTLWSWKPYTC